MARILTSVLLAFAMVVSAACCGDPCNCRNRRPSSAVEHRGVDSNQFLTTGRCPGWPTPSAANNLQQIIAIAQGAGWTAVVGAAEHCRNYGKNHPTMTCAQHETKVNNALAYAQTGNEGMCLQELSHNDPLSPPPTRSSGCAWR